MSNSLTAEVGDGVQANRSPLALLDGDFDDTKLMNAASRY
jgi:hypothetical protein